MAQIIDIFLHLDTYLSAVITTFGGFTYAFLFIIIFLETGLVITPLLPGDSLLFAAGTFAALGSLNYWCATIILFAGAILGDTANYWIGSKGGRHIFSAKRNWFNESHLQAAEVFYATHGAKTIILARFIPIIRTFAPFVAGIGRMRYRTFLFYNIIGGALWVFLFVTGGYYFGTIQVVRDRFHIVILAIIFISILPGVVRGMRQVMKISP